MEVRLIGTGGDGGWPQPGCGCASCERARSAGRRRAPDQVIVDGVLRIDREGPVALGPEAEHWASPAGRGGRAVGPAGYRVERVPAGWDVTGPDGARLLVGRGPVPGAAPGGAPDAAGPDPTGPDAGPDPTGPDPTGPDPTGPDAGPDATGPRAGAYDIALLDMLENPARLGALRHRGLVHAGTVAAVLHADHRVSSEEELARRCRYWSVTLCRDGDVLATTPATRATGPGGGHSAGQARRVLVLGGARSGKSRHAELRLAAEPCVTYLAAGPYPAGAQPAADAEWARRIADHQARRPSWWQTVESADAAGVLRSGSGAILFDGAGTWLAAVLDEAGAWPGDDGDAQARPGQPPARAQRLVAARVDELIEAWRQTPARVVAVSDEVGSSIHPPTQAGRLFRDQLGWLNQRLAAEADETVLLVAGRALTLPS
jgi:adenosylcobinamide kinase / adenosylcobinamide-phosphate guanylyltransferase